MANEKANLTGPKSLFYKKAKDKKDQDKYNYVMSEKAMTAKKDLPALKKSKSVDEFFVNMSESDRLSVLNPDGSLNQNVLQDRYESSQVINFLDGDAFSYDQLFNRPDGNKIIKGLVQAMPSLNSLIEKYPTRDIKSEIKTAYCFIKRFNKG